MITTKKPRQSSMELLRILAMFLILVLHADFWSLGRPSITECVQQPLSSVARILIESISAISVNVFVLISGWFSIKPSLKGFCNLIFQCVYFFLGIYVVLLLTGQVALSVRGIRYCLMLTPLTWFVKSYIALYILAPVLNVFCEKSTRAQFKVVILAFFAFQTIYGLSYSVSFICSGNSTFSFIGLYLLARYLNFYKPAICKWGGVLFILSVILDTVACHALVCVGFESLAGVIYANINPLVIIGACGLLLWFANLRIKNSQLINWFGASSFAVYLLHANPFCGVSYFQPLIRHLYSLWSGIPCLSIIGMTLIAIFLIAVILDQPRKWLWSKIARKLV